MRCLIAIIFLYFSACFGTLHVQNLTIEEKVGQLLIVHFHGESANEDARLLIEDVKVGGFIYYKWANALVSPAQIKKLSASLQHMTYTNLTPIPLFICIDQEGGRVTRLEQGFTQFPSNQTIASAGQSSLAKLVAFIMGQEIKAVGINTNFAPVVDINNNPKNLVIGSRSFSDCPEIVTNFAENALQGYAKANMIATLKHFPGHGDVAIDSHCDLPLLSKTIEDLEKMELIPFRDLACKADLIMTAHLLVPAFDAENCSTLSQKTLNYLRTVINFQGVIISDSLVMAGVLKKYQTVEETAIRALIAGCDILLLGGKQLIDNEANAELTAKDVLHVHKKIVEAVRNGRIPEKRLNEAVMRILYLKQKYLGESITPYLNNL